MIIVRLCFSFVRSLAINYIINVLDLLSLSLSMFADDQTKPKSGRYFFLKSLRGDMAYVLVFLVISISGQTFLS